MLHWGGFMPVWISSVPWLCPMSFTYTTILPTYLVVFIQSNFVKVPIRNIIPYRMIIHGFALHMSCNQDCRMGTSWLSGCQGLGEINTLETLLYIPAHYDLSVTYRLVTSSLSFICCLMTILRVFIQERIKKLQFGHNWSPFNPSRANMIMRTISLTLLMSGWSQQIWNPEGISNPSGTPRS